MISTRPRQCSILRLLRQFVYLAILCLSLPVFASGTLVSQGVSSIGADAWHTAGYDGRGVTIAVIDIGFYGYRDLLGTELPPTSRLMTRGFGTSVAQDAAENTEDAAHGTAVAEIVYDIAPGADYIFIAIDGDDAEAEALTWLLTQNVDIIVASLGGPPFCLPGETDRLESVYREVRNAGILYVAAAGNEGASNWTGRFTDQDGDGVHEFSSGNEWLEVYLSEGEPIDLYLQWDDDLCSASANDYILKVTDYKDTVLFENDYDNALDGPTEEIVEAAPYEGYYYLVIEKYAADRDAWLTLTWTNGPEFDTYKRDRSILVNQPALSTHVMAVGAIDWNQFQIASYSAGGPTREGLIKPDIVAPTCVVTASYGGDARDYREDADCGFPGTSAAAPHAAGAAVLVKQAFPEFTADELQAYLEAHAIDMGKPGKDNVYGAGRLLLPPPPE